MKCLCASGLCPLSIPPTRLFPLSHRCSQCHPTKALLNKTVLCSLVEKSHTSLRRLHGNQVAKFDKPFWMFPPSVMCESLWDLWGWRRWWVNQNRLPRWLWICHEWTMNNHRAENSKNWSEEWGTENNQINLMSYKHILRMQSAMALLKLKC